MLQGISAILLLVISGLVCELWKSKSTVKQLTRENEELKTSNELAVSVVQLKENEYNRLKEFCKENNIEFITKERE